MIKRDEDYDLDGWGLLYWLCDDYGRESKIKGLSSQRGSEQTLHPTTRKSFNLTENSPDLQVQHHTASIAFEFEFVFLNFSERLHLKMLRDAPTTSRSESIAVEFIFECSLRVLLKLFL